MNAISIAILLSLNPVLQRDSFGVPRIEAPNVTAAFRLAGKAVAEDRLWQMELSRHVARGRSAEILGATALNSDKDILATGYSDDELLAQVKALPKIAQQAWSAYVQGVNDCISERKEQGKLPEGYTQLGFQPEPWTLQDSAAIAVMMARKFGSGGAGELRDLGLYQYLLGQKLDDKALDVFDDIAWFNAKESPTTVDPKDDPLKDSHPAFFIPSREDSKRHLAMLPKVNLIELMGTIQRAEGQNVTKVASAVSAPYKTGSYAMVVSGARTSSGAPILLGAPQMGHTSPSIVHEISIRCPQIQVTGMGVPGIPGVLIGTTPNFAWTLTSGVADVVDIGFFPKKSATTYAYGTKTLPIEERRHEIKVRGGDSVEYPTQRTVWGPVLLDSKTGNCLYAQRASWWKKELQGFGQIFSIYNAKDSKSLFRTLYKIPLSFNFFYALRSGEIGWRYCGDMPIRASGFDPRFPIPGSPEADWKGMVPPEKMPYVINPSGGMISNWNNKPASWWPNLDTPVWGELFRVTSLRAAAPAGKATIEDLRAAAESISRSDNNTTGAFIPDLLEAVASLESPDNTTRSAALALQTLNLKRINGDPAPLIYDTTFGNMQDLLFAPKLGTVVGNLRTVAQPSLVLRALRRQTKMDYLAGRDPEALWREAFSKAVQSLRQQFGDDVSKWRYAPGAIRYKGLAPIPNIDRGTFIQLIDLGAEGLQRSVAGPGQAEEGEHASDQVPLVQEWRFKPMWKP